MSETGHPNLFIVGAPKCGTTSIHHYLKQHPDVYMSDRKEPHYFSTDFHRASDELHGERKFFKVRDPEQYAELFASAGAARVVGESSTSYLYSREAARQIAAYSPDAKIVICLRDPFALLRSWHSYLHFCLEEDIADFRAALEAEPRRRAAQGRGGTVPVSTQHPERLYYREFIRLSEQIRRYTGTFDPARIHFVVLEELEREPRRTYAALLQFLNLPPIMPATFEVRNARSIRRSGLLSTLQRDVFDRLSRAHKPQWLKAMVPTEARRWAYAVLGRTYAKLDKANTARGGEQSYPVDPVLERELRAELCAEVESISSLIGRPDLSAIWGYESAAIDVPPTRRHAAATKVGTTNPSGAGPGR
jgi:hypothetical protein